MPRGLMRRMRSNEASHLAQVQRYSYQQQIVKYYSEVSVKIDHVIG